MNSLAGTWRLVRLALRRDRIKLPIVIVVLAGVFMSSAAATIDLYGTAQQQLTYAATTAPSVVGRVFSGPLDGPNIGAIVMNETFVFTAVAVAFMSTLTVIRHTRQNEETGRSELIESGIVSRHASLAAALIVTLGANVIFAGLVVLSLTANDFSLSSSIGTAAAMAAVGMSFAAVAAVAAQLTDGARGANSLSAMVIGIAFLLRAIGDSTGNLVQNGLAVQSSFPSWLSPLGWAQQIHPLTQGNWWIFGLFGVFFIALTCLAVVFMAKRDIGMGMIATRLGVARAPRQLLSPFGLAWRLQKGILRGWAIAIIILGGSYGLVIKEFENLLKDNEQLSEAFGQLGGNITDSFLGILIGFMAITIAGYSVQALMRMRAEEANGQLESILGTGVSRSRWLLSHIGFIALGVVILSLLNALSMGTTFILSTGGSWSELGTITSAALVQSTAVFALVGFVVAVFSLLRNMAVAVAWGSFSACLLLMQLGVLLNLPQWVMNISPFGHLPIMPAERFSAVPVISLLAAGLVLTLFGVTYFNRRDITAT